MKPYKLRHKPTGLFYQPKKHRGSHLSPRGKVYQTKTNILNLNGSGGKPRPKIYVNAHTNNQVYKKTKDILDWQECTWGSHIEVQAETLASDWEIVEL